MARRRTWFTLVELLVVMAIISILAALLIPTLHHAMVRARMVACASNLRQAGTVMLSYATEHRGLFPYRKNIRGPERDRWSTPYTLRHPSAVAETDDTQLFIDLGLDEPRCPFNQNPTWTPGDATWAASSYSFYAGWQGGEDPDCKLFKMTDRMQWNGATFDILAGDIFQSYVVATELRLSHPDDDGAMEQRPNFWRTNGSLLLPTPVDLNFCRTDGSVFLLKKTHSLDSRLKMVPHENNSGTTDPNTQGGMLLPDRTP